MHTHTHIHTFKSPRSVKQQTDRGGDIECQERQTALHCAPFPPFFTEIVCRTEEPHWTTSRLQRLPHNKSAGKQVHRLRRLDPEREASKARDASREHDEMATRQQLEHCIYDEFKHRESSRVSMKSSMHSLAHVYRLLPQLKSKASFPSVHHKIESSVQSSKP